MLQLKSGEILRLAWGRSVLYHRVGLKLESGTLDVPVFCTGPWPQFASFPRVPKWQMPAPWKGLVTVVVFKGTGRDSLWVD